MSNEEPFPTHDRFPSAWTTRGFARLSQSPQLATVCPIVGEVSPNWSMQLSMSSIPKLIDVKCDHFGQNFNFNLEGGDDEQKDPQQGPTTAHLKVFVHC